MVPVYSSEIKVAYDKDKKNWENAHKEGLSPHLYLYGYYKEKMKIMHKGNVIQERYNLYKIIISEAYDMSLYTYYNGYDNPGYLNSKKH